MKNERKLKTRYNKLLKENAKIRQQNALLSKFKTTAQEKIDAIEDFYLWCDKNNHEANYTGNFIRYCREIKRSENDKYSF